MWHQRPTPSISGRSGQDHLLFCSSSFGHQQPRGPRQQNLPTEPDILGGAAAQSVPLCWQKKSTVLCVFLTSMLGAFRDALFQDTFTATPAEKNGPLCLTAKLLTCGTTLTDNHGDAGVRDYERGRGGEGGGATSGLLHLWRVVALWNGRFISVHFHRSRIDTINRQVCGDVGRILNTV